MVESRHPELAQHLTSLHQHLWQCSDALQADGLLLGFIASLRPLARTATRELRDGATARLAPVIDAMRAALHEPLALADLAAVANLSPFHFLRKFKAQYHLTPHQMLMALRLAEAKRLLARGVRPADVAAATGLTDQAHLTRAFARRYGVTPARYQRQIR
ncbi:helix-turn-helix domain-containing protein [Pseudoxanthomonas sp. UC29_72]